MAKAMQSVLGASAWLRSWWWCPGSMRAMAWLVWALSPMGLAPGSSGSSGNTLEMSLERCIYATSTLRSHRYTLCSPYLGTN